MNFVIEQIALCPPDPAKAIELLKALGLNDWVHDIVNAEGDVRGLEASNQAALAFNYQASSQKLLELEVLYYTSGANWMQGAAPCVSHLGMHCTHDELVEWSQKFAALGIASVQDVFTTSHTNPVIAGQRWYRYVIFNTRPILGVDLKFIVRRGAP